MYKNIILTGDKGLIGLELYNMLRCNTEIRDKVSVAPKIYGFDSGSSFKTWLSDFHHFKSKLTDVDLIIHCGGVSDSRVNDGSLWELNYEATRLLGQVAEYYDAHFLFFSSSHAIEPKTAYGWSKKVAENLLRYMLPRENLCIFRVFNVWHWHESNKANPSIIYKMLYRQLEKVYKGCFRDFIHVSDVCEAVKVVLKGWQAGVYEIGTGVPIDLVAFISTLYQELSIDLSLPEIVECPVEKVLVANDSFALPYFYPKQGKVFNYLNEFVAFMNDYHIAEDQPTDNPYTNKD